MNRLSPRQLQIVELVGRDGKEWTEVKDELGISLSTIENHVSRILKRFKCGLPPRQALTRIYFEHVGGTPDG